MTLIVLVVVGLLGAAVTPSLTRGWTLAEQRVAYWSLGAHLLSAPAQEIVYRKFYGGGDMFHYAMFGELLTELIWIDPSTALPGVFRLLVQQEHRLPMWVLGQGTSTGSMSAVSGLLGIFVGSSLTAQGAVIGVVSYSGKCACYSVFRVGLDARSRFLLAVGQLLVPTAVFWSAALLKEPMIAGAFGWLIYALGQLIERRRTGALLIAAACTVWIGLFKPYLLVGVAAGFGAWVYVARVGVRSRVLRLRPGWLALGLALSVLLVGAVGRVFPRYDLEEVGERIAFLQTYAERGRSSYQVGDANQSSLAGQMAFAPFALASTYFRPFLFEISSATAAVNSVEAFGVLLLFVAAWRRNGFAGLLARVFANSRLAFAVVLTTVLGVGVGLATSNLGSLSRYRAPFYTLIVTIGVLWYLPRAAAERTRQVTTTNDPLQSKLDYAVSLEESSGSNAGA